MSSLSNLFWPGLAVCLIIGLAIYNRRYAVLPKHGVPQSTALVSLETYGKRMNRSPHAISVTDLEGRFVLVNPKKVRYLGLNSEADVLGHFPWDFAPPSQRSDEASFIEGMKQIDFAAAGEQPTFEWMLNDREGKQFSIEVSLQPIELAGTTYVRAIATQLASPESS